MTRPTLSPGPERGLNEEWAIRVQEELRREGEGSCYCGAAVERYRTSGVEHLRSFSPAPKGDGRWLLEETPDGLVMLFRPTGGSHYLHRCDGEPDG